ncbi:MAG TPA: regulatory protein RecX [Flavobacterium sp.]|uniref:regulatory protein RecX n=1 Tax=unclassified Flavobacterium TaxID=196869 RepID=UPI0025C315E1|nr:MULTISPECIES: regulatory protein RecX [unclassified Flavobacterium]HRE79360.1 regulatory protein RecX [Flavobacterium sp.]
MNSQSATSLSEIVQKMEYYCSYQERCHAEVVQKLYTLSVPQNQHDEVIVHLINHNFLNEERFAKLFSISKFHQKKWGKKRISSELKQRNLSDYLIRIGLKEIPEEEYESTFSELAEKTWDSITEKNILKKRKKFCDTLLRKGWESDWVYETSKKLNRLS